MKKELFYLLGCKGDGCESSFSYTGKEIASLSWRCRNCRFPLDDTKQIDIKIEEEAPKYLAKQRPLTFSAFFLQQLVWEPFIRAIPASILDRDMYFGDVIGPDGKRIEDWLTCRCRYELFRRGTKDVMLPTICKDCGYVRYWAGGKWHLYPTPPEDVDIFLCSGGLLFRESIYQYLDMEQWRKKVYVTKLTVANKPLDGLDLPPFQIPRDLKWVAEHPEIERL